jgi:transposase
MTRRKSTPPEAALVAIDVAKHRNEVLIEAVRGGRRRRMTILNTRADHDKLVTTLQAMQMPVVVGLEPTGNYHRVLAHRLIDAGFTVRLISSMALARTREALHNGWDKNDPKDAQVILHMLGIGATMVYQDPLAAGINDLQELSKTHEVVSKAKTELWHRLLTHYLRLRQVPGIGPIHALTILAEAGDLRRFRHHRQFLKFCGLDLATHQSGQFRGQTRLSKY